MGKKDEGSTEVDKMTPKGGQNDTQRWTIWHKGGQNGRDGGVGTEIAIFRVKTFKSEPASSGATIND